MLKLKIDNHKEISFKVVHYGDREYLVFLGHNSWNNMKVYTYIFDR